MNKMVTSSSSRPSVSPHRLSHCTPIEEGNEDEELSQGHGSFRISSPLENVLNNRHLHPTPLHQNSFDGRGKDSSMKKKEKEDEEVNRGRCGISCNNCRPTGKEKTSVVTVDNNGGNRQYLTSPNVLLKAVFSSLVKKSPGLCNVQSPVVATATKEEELKNIAVAELSQKLVQATRNRDEAVLEITRLKYSISELEKKLNKLENYCHNLKSGHELSSNKYHLQNKELLKIGNQTPAVIQHFLISVSEARSSVKLLSRALFFQLKQLGGKVFDKLCLLLQPYDEKNSLSRNTRDLFLYFEALFNKVFYEDFESVGFQKSAPTLILNPIVRCESNIASFHKLQRLTWDEVLTKGTRHFSEEFSKFCDRKMSEIAAMLGWNRAWPEKLLQSFFIASKNVWLVHHLAHSIHPSLPIFRVDKGSSFDSVYMEDMGGEKARNLVPGNVRIMVAPGFYVYENVVKCKVVCRYQNISNGFNNGAASVQPSQSEFQVVTSIHQVNQLRVSNATPPLEELEFKKHPFHIEGNGKVLNILAT